MPFPPSLSFTNTHTNAHTNAHASPIYPLGRARILQLNSSRSGKFGHSRYCASLAPIQADGVTGTLEVIGRDYDVFIVPLITTRVCRVVRVDQVS